MAWNWNPFDLFKKKDLGDDDNIARGGRGAGDGAGAAMGAAAGAAPGWVYIAALSLSAYQAYKGQRYANRARHETEEERDRAADAERARELQLKQEREQRADDEAKAAAAGRSAGQRFGGGSAVSLFKFSGNYGTGFGGQASASSEDKVSGGARGRGRLFGN
jgi:hypothetical protein